MATMLVRTGPTAFVERQLDALSPRDRMLLVGLVGFGTSLFLMGFVYFAYSILDGKAAAVREAKERVQAMQIQQQEYNQAAATFQAHEERLRSKPPVSTFVEELARKHEIAEQLSNINAKGTPEVVGSLAQQRYTVEIKKAPQENLYRFLHELETSGYPVSVEPAAFKSQPAKDAALQMNLTLDLVVLSVAEG